MADLADQANELMELRMEEKLAQRTVTHAASAFECEECGDAIPEQRRKWGGVTRCIGCQQELESRQRLSR